MSERNVKKDFLRNDESGWEGGRKSSGPGHFVQFYETERFLVDSVASFFGAGLTAGEIALGVGTPSHRIAIVEELESRGIRLAGAEQRKRHNWFDAAETLSKFMVGNEPDARRFGEVLGAMIASLVSQNRPIRIFGEMVYLLWANGNRAGAVHLEELWNELAKCHKFLLLCAYPINSFAGVTNFEPFKQICDCHSRVFPAESYLALNDPDAQLRTISEMQQKASSLDAEVQRRAGIEEALFASERRFGILMAEKDLNAAKSVAEKASRAKDKFMAMLSHELRTPLTPVLMATGVLKHDLTLAPHVREQLAMMHRNVMLEARLIDDLLDLSRIVNGKFGICRQEAEAHELIRNAVRMIRSDAEAKSLTVQLKLAARRDRINGDPARLQQVFWNLLQNAVKFTSEDGRITLSTRNGVSGELIVELEDTGIGIDPPELSTIFDAFEQGDEDVHHFSGGLGLGLAISKAIVDGHGGRIQGHSDGRGHGSRFEIELPTVPEAPPDFMAQAQEELRSITRITGQRGILLVEDHEDSLIVLQRLLEISGYAVQACGSVADALQMLENSRFDLLITDIALPDGTGLEIIQQARLRQPDIPAIALTGFGSPADLLRTDKAGFQAHLVKPIDIERLKETIRRVFAEPAM